MIKKIQKKLFNEFGCVEQSAFSEWFDKHIQPINKALDEAVEVHCREQYGKWYADNDFDRHEFEKKHYPRPNKALLINIEPIKQETAADVLRDLERLAIYEGFDERVLKIMERAKVVLTRNEEGEK